MEPASYRYYAYSSNIKFVYLYLGEGKHLLSWLVLSPIKGPRSRIQNPTTSPTDKGGEGIVLYKDQKPSQLLGEGRWKSEIFVFA